MESNFSLRIKKEILEEQLKARVEDLESVKRLLIRATGSEKNNRQREINDLLADIERIKQNIRELDTVSLIQEIDNLKLILSNHFQDIEKSICIAYKLSLPKRFIEKNISVNIDCFIQNLIRIGVTESTYSCLEKFVIFLILDDNLPSSLLLSLKKWSEQNIKPEKYLHLLEKLKEEKQQYNSGLLVAVSELGNDYIIEAWLIKNLSQYTINIQLNSDCDRLEFIKPNTEDSKSKVSHKFLKTDSKLSNLSEIIKGLIAQLNQCDINLEQIHVFVPYKLMNHEADCCPVYDEDLTSIGEEYQVILRCSERLRGKDPRTSNWKRKSINLQSKLEQKITNQVVLLGNEPEPKFLENQLKKQRHAIAVKITNTFENQQPGELLWKSSMPIALWIRKQLPNIDNETQLNRLLEKESSLGSICLSELPEQVKNIRIDASGHDPPDSHVGRHICLMWDDPNLLPPEQFLTHEKL